MQFNLYRATELLNSNYEERMSDEVASLFYSYVNSHIRMLTEVGSISANEEWNHVITVENDESKILGFRYYYWQGMKDSAHLFAVVMSDSIKRKGYALETFYKAIEHSNSNNIRKFNVTVNSKDNEERRGLFESYKRECSSFLNKSNSFYITHMGEEFTYPPL